MKCFVNFINGDNGEEDAYRVLTVPAEAEHQVDAWVQSLIQEMKPTQKELDKKFGATHSLLIIVKEGSEEVVSLHVD